MKSSSARGPIGPATGGVMAPAQSSAKTWDAVGSGSRPTPSKMETPTSAPKEPHTLGRAPTGWLK